MRLRVALLLDRHRLQLHHRMWLESSTFISLCLVFCTRWTFSGHIDFASADSLHMEAPAKPTQMMLDSGGQHLPEEKGGRSHLHGRRGRWMELEVPSSSRLLLPSHRGTLCL